MHAVNSLVEAELELVDLDCWASLAADEEFEPAFHMAQVCLP